MADKVVKVAIVGKDELTPAVKSSQSSLKNLESQAGSTNSKLSSISTKSAQSAFKDLEGSLGTVGSKLQSTGVNFGDILGSGGTAAVAAIGAGAVIGKFAVDSVTHFADLGTSILQFQRIAGTTATQSSQWVAVLQQYGIDAGQAATSVGMLAKNLGQHPEKLATFGVEVARTNTGAVDLNGTLLNIISTYNNMQDPTQRAALAQAAFGKSWRDLTPILSQSADSIKTAFDSVPKGDILSQSQLDQAERFNVSMEKLKEQVQGLEVAIGSALVPVLSQAADAVGPLLGGIDALIVRMQELADKGSKKNASAWDAFTGLFTQTLPGAFETFYNQVTKDTPLNDGNAKSADKLTEAYAGLNTSIRATLGPMDDASVKALENADATAAAAASAAQAKTDAAALGAVEGDVEKAYKAATDAINAQYDALSKNTLGFIDARLAQLQDTTAITDYKKSLDNSKLSQDDHTKSLLDTEKQLITTAQKTADAATANQHFGDAAQEAAAKSQVQISYLQGLEKTLGPNDPLRAAIDGYIAQLSAIPAEKATTITAQTAAAATALQHIIDQMNSINSKTVTVDVFGHVHAPGAGYAKGGLVTAASGGYRYGPMVLVGEQGPELVSLPTGSYVHTASESAWMVSHGPLSNRGGRPGSGGGGSPVYNITVNAGMGADGRGIAEQVVNVLKQIERRYGRLPVRAIAA
jgi:hypothetical protein